MLKKGKLKKFLIILICTIDITMCKKRINPETKAGNLSSDIVYESRRVFDWVINSDEN